MARGQPARRSSAAASAPAKASPAPVVSTTCTAGAAAVNAVPSATASTPRGPSVTTAAEAVAAVHGRREVLGRAPAGRDASCQGSGLDRVDEQHVQVREERGRQRSRWRGVQDHACAAAPCPRCDFAHGLQRDFELQRAAVVPGPRAASGTVAASTMRRSHPEPRVIAFWPLASTWISATPVGAASRRTQPTSTPEAISPESAVAANRSVPTAPAMATSAPARRAAIA